MPGLTLQVIDGNYFAGTDHRLQVLRGHSAALPGMAVVVRDHGTGLITHVLGEPDASVNERALADRLLDTVGGNELVVADRNFCFAKLLTGIAERRSFFLVRLHRRTQYQELGSRHQVGDTDTGEVFEQRVRVAGRRLRLVVVVLNEPTRDGETEIRLLTNQSSRQVRGVVVARTYRLRWRLEATFLEVTTSVQCELNTRGYPQAALLTFALVLCACKRCGWCSERWRWRRRSTRRRCRSRRITVERDERVLGRTGCGDGAGELVVGGHGERGVVRRMAGTASPTGGCAPVREDDTRPEKAGGVHQVGPPDATPLHLSAAESKESLAQNPTTTLKGMVYFTPERHVGFADRVQSLLGRLGGQVLRFPVPAGTAEGDRSVKHAAGLAALIDEHRQAVARFGEDTREGPLERAAEMSRSTQFKVQAYAEYLLDEKAKLDRDLAAARDELWARVEHLATIPTLA